MKSLLISGIYFPPRTGGISEFMGALCTGLGPERVCCLTGVRANGSGVGFDSGPRVYRRPAAFARARPVQAVGWAMAISQIMVRDRPRVVQLATAYEGYLGLWLRRWLKLPYVVFAHGNEILDAMRGKNWPIPLLALQNADRVLAVSQFTASLVQRTGVSAGRIEIVYPGCDVNRFQQLPPRMELRQRLLGSRYRDRVVLTVGNLVARKGHEMVIRALANLHRCIPEVTYLIVGDGPYRTELERLATAMGVGDRVKFAGRVAPEDLPDVYALCDVFVMASRERFESGDVEGFGLVFLEASACGKPVVGGRSGGIPEAIVDGATGLLVDPEEVDDIANALARLLSNDDLASRLGQQGRERVLHDFQWARVGSRVQGILDSIVNEKSIRS